MLEIVLLGEKAKCYVERSQNSDVLRSGCYRQIPKKDNQIHLRGKKDHSFLREPSSSFFLSIGSVLLPISSKKKKKLPVFCNP